MTPNWSDYDSGDGPSYETTRREEERQHRMEEQARRDAREQIARMKRDHRFYELPLWQREQMEERAR